MSSKWVKNDSQTQVVIRFYGMLQEGSDYNKDMEDRYKFYPLISIVGQDSKTVYVVLKHSEFQRKHSNYFEKKIMYL